MGDNIIKLSDVVATILSKENKDKSLGETTKDINEYVIEIKELVDKGEISYDALRKEISKHLTNEDITLPGSVAQLLIGCVDGEGACPLQKSYDDIPFAYDNKLDKFIPLSKKEKPENDEVYAILYLSGNPKDISLKNLYYLQKLGFKKIKIQYKELNSSSYKTLQVENLGMYIYSQPEKNIDNGLIIMGIILLFFLVIYLSKK